MEEPCRDEGYNIIQIGPEIEEQIRIAARMVQSREAQRRAEYYRIRRLAYANQPGPALPADMPAIGALFDRDRY